MTSKFSSNYLTFQPNFELDESKIQNFLNKFETNIVSKDKVWGHKKYMIELQKISNKEIKVLHIHTEDLESYFSQNEEDKMLLDSILKNTKRYIEIFSSAVDKLLPAANKQINFDEEKITAEDISYNQRMQNISANMSNNSNNNNNNNIIQTQNFLPKELMRKYELIIIPGPGAKQHSTPLRNLRALQIGSLVTVKGIVVKATDVKPFLKVACYSCDICGSETYQVINSRTYMPLTDCQSPQCRTNHSHGNITQINRTSKFIEFQEINIQEPSLEVPTGHVPRNLKIMCFGSSCRQCTPGDFVTITGIYLPAMNNGKNNYRSRLVHDTYIEAFIINKEKKSYSESHMTNDMFEALKDNSSTIYDDLAKSIAPEIYGMEDIKKALLLLLVGGVDKETTDGMKIRGNINILLMGDPGIAKSQLLKYISHISPRGVYTTGKGSSGVGLTAAVVKDSITNDLVLEGGALVLADMGVCCIDEFDKMSDYDRANIHEVMEQQTVSIAKAGITTRLNARTSVLAAANPLYGRYNENLSPHENINLPAALLSRFDLIFLLLDKPNKERDYLLAKHVTYVHQFNKAYIEEEADKKVNLYDENFIRSYIAQAKKSQPIIPSDLHNYLVQKYVEKRKTEKEDDKEGYQYITPRSLLAVIRLAQALAKLRMEDKVMQLDIDEALRLVQVGQSTINKKGENSLVNIEKPKKQDAKSQIFNIISELCKKVKDGSKTVSIDLVKKKIKGRFKDMQLQNTIKEYVDLNILYVDSNNTEVTLL